MLSDGSLLAARSGQTGAQVCETYGLLRVGVGRFEKTDFSGDQRFKGVPSLTKVEVEFASDGSYTIRTTHDDDSTFEERGQDADDNLEYFLDPGSLQDEGFEPEEEG